MLQDYHIFALKYPKKKQRSSAHSCKFQHHRQKTCKYHQTNATNAVEMVCDLLENRSKHHDKKRRFCYHP
jgi:hypothetical protein